LSKKSNRRSKIAVILSKKSNRYGSYFRTTIVSALLDNMASILERRLLFLHNMAANLER
jgi:hypothetical protein